MSQSEKGYIRPDEVPVGSKFKAPPIPKSDNKIKVCFRVHRDDAELVRGYLHAHSNRQMIEKIWDYFLHIEGLKNE